MSASSDLEIELGLYYTSNICFENQISSILRLHGLKDFSHDKIERYLYIVIFSSSDFWW